MSDLYSILNNLTDDDIRLQLAFFDSVTIGNAAKETGSRIISGLADMANSFAEIFSSKLKVEYDYKKVSDMVEAKYMQLKTADRTHLMSMLELKLLEIAGAQGSIDVSTVAGRDKLLMLAVNAAGAGYSINQYIAPAHKMQIISDKYNEAFMDNLYQSIKNITPDQFREWSAIMDKAIASADIEMKRVVHKELMPDAFNGMGVLKSLRKQKTQEKLRLVIECFGVEAFDYKTVEIKTMYQAIRTFNKVSSLQLARMINIAVRRYNKPLYAKDELMPSYVAEDDKAKLEQDMEYAALINQVKEIDGETDKLIKELEGIEKRQADAEEKLEKAKEHLDEVDKEFSELEAKKNEYMSGSHTEQETKSYYARVNEVKRQLDRASEEAGVRERKNQELLNRIYLTKEKIEMTKSQTETYHNKLDEQTNERKQNLQRLWSAYYYKFRFSDDIFTELVKNYDRKHIVVIEEMLKEMHDSSDYSIYLDGDKLNVYTGGRKPIVFIYENGVFNGIFRDKSVS